MERGVRVTQEHKDTTEQEQKTYEKQSQGVIN